jgi:hypothetical protein
MCWVEEVGFINRKRLREQTQKKSRLVIPVIFLVKVKTVDFPRLMKTGLFWSLAMGPTLQVLRR